jgi:acetyl-CoA C-acetyltransferase
MRNVAIISVGYNGRFVAKRPDVNIPEMIQPAVANAIKKTKMKHSDIGVVVEGNMPTFEGINYPHLWFSDHIGAAGKPVLRISTGGTTGMSVFHGGYYCVASGMFDVAMVIGWEKHDEGDVQVGLMGIVLPEAFSLFQFGPDMSGGKGGGMGLLGGGGSTGGASFQALSYLAKHKGGTPEHIDKMAAQARSNAAKNPYAHLQHPNCTAADIAKTPMVSYPLRYGHTCPASCGACVMLLVAEEKVKKFADTDRVAWIKAVATASSDATTGNLVDGQINDPAEQAICEKIAAPKAYKLAGIQNPKKEIQMCEVYDGFAHQELMWPEKLHLVDNSCQAIDEGRLAIDGEMPVNPSGGVVSTNAIGASAMVRVAEASLQVMGLAEGGHQVPRRVKNAVAHGWGGLFQFVTITILGDEPVKR